MGRLGGAIRELRELAHGVRPASLDAGLATALAELAGRAPVRTVLDVTEERFASEVETAAYFVVSEALANALKHATPALIEVIADRVGGRLVVVVSDDGQGGATAVPGSGLAGMSDRVEALGGTLTVDSPTGRRDPRPGGAAVRVVVAEDQVLLREGLARLFRDAGHEVVALAGDGDEARGAVGDTVPDLLVADIRMPPTYGEEGLDLARWVREHHPGVGVLMLSQHVHGGVVDLVSGRGFGYLLKDRVLDVADFLDAAQRVASGGSALDPDLVATLVRRDDDALDRLSTREREVLGLMAEGLTNAGIAARLVLTERTVESHTRSVFMKLDLHGGRRRAPAGAGRAVVPPGPLRSVAVRTPGPVLAAMSLTPGIRSVVGMTNYSTAHGVDIAGKSHSRSARTSYVALVLGILSLPGSLLTWDTGLPGEGFVWGLPVAVAAVIAGVVALRGRATARWAAVTGLVLGGAMALMIVVWTAFAA